MSTMDQLLLLLVRHRLTWPESHSWACSQGHCAAGMISSSLELHRYATGRKSRVVTALTLLKSHLFRCVTEHLDRSKPAMRWMQLSLISSPQLQRCRAAESCCG